MFRGYRFEIGSSQVFLKEELLELTLKGLVSQAEEVKEEKKQRKAREINETEYGCCPLQVVELKDKSLSWI